MIDKDRGADIIYCYMTIVRHSKDLGGFNFHIRCFAYTVSDKRDPPFLTAQQSVASISKQLIVLNIKGYFTSLYFKTSCKYRDSIRMSTFLFLQGDGNEKNSCRKKICTFVDNLHVCRVSRHLSLYYISHHWCLHHYVHVHCWSRQSSFPKGAHQRPHVVIWPLLFIHYYISTLNWVPNTW